MAGVGVGSIMTFYIHMLRRKCIKRSVFWDVVVQWVCDMNYVELGNKQDLQVKLRYFNLTLNIFVS